MKFGGILARLLFCSLKHSDETGPGTFSNSYPVGTVDFACECSGRNVRLRVHVRGTVARPVENI
jgi:hypothetical protein